MKQNLLSFLIYILGILSHLIIRRYKPKIIGITGSVGKTSTKLAIYTVLRRSGVKRIRMAGGNLNNELGLPLAIIGNYDKSGGLFFWSGAALDALIKLVSPLPQKSYPRILILEYGALKPGDIARLIKIAKPEIAVITALGEVPVHIEFYKGREEVVKEKAELVKAVGAGGAVVLNADDEAVLQMRELAQAKVTTFGFSEKARLRIINFENRSEFGKHLGISFKLETEGTSVPIRIEGAFGRAQAYAAAAAAAVGLLEGLNLVKISEALALYEGERGRTRLLHGIKESFIIDDTYNASPASTQAALEILADLPAPRKIAVLGDMLELGEYTEEAHREIGKLVKGIANILITVGLRAKFIADEAVKGEFPKENIYSFETSDEAKKKVQELIESRDLVLVKGSQGIRMEKIVLEIMREPERAKELLTRQYGKWLKS